MKAVVLAVTAVLLLAKLEAAEFPKSLPCDKEGKVIPKFVTREKFTFAASTVLAKYPDGLLFKVGTMAPPTKWATGAKECVMLVPEGSLPEAVRVAVGGFNSEASNTAQQQRKDAVGAGQPESFPREVTGGWPVVKYYNTGDAVFGEDPFAAKRDLGESRTWEEYQTEVAKLDSEKQKSDEDHAATVAKRMKAIADPADTKWGWGSGGEIELSADGKAQHSTWKRPGKWEKREDGAIIVRHEAKLFTITFDADGIGKVEDLNGNGTKLTFRSKKEPKEKPKTGLSRLEDKGEAKARP